LLSLVDARAVFRAINGLEELFNGRSGISAWNCLQATRNSATSQSCCTPQLTGSLRAVSHQLADSQIFSAHSEEVVVCFAYELTRESQVLFACRNKLNPVNSYHLLHLLHHLNGLAGKGIGLADRTMLVNSWSRMNASIFSSLLDAYNSDARPRLFRLHTVGLGIFPPPLQDDFPIHPSIYARIHCAVLRFPYQRQKSLDWLRASLLGDQLAAAYGGGGVVDLMDACLRSRHCHQMQFLVGGWETSMEGEEVDLILEVSQIQHSNTI
jgi:hypothetical protein